MSRRTKWILLVLLVVLVVFGAGVLWLEARWSRCIGSPSICKHVQADTKLVSGFLIGI